MLQKSNPVGYAIAYYEIAKESNKIKEVHSQVSTFKDILNANKDMIKFLNDPEILNKEKFDFLDDVFKDYDRGLINLIKVMIEKRNVNLLEKVLSHYLKMSNNDLNIRFAKIITAMEISDKTLKLIKEKLEKFYNGVVEIKTEINPDLISGFEIHIGSQIISRNVSADLINFKNFINEDKEV
ncbi:ATP synthase F1 subunit delta [Mycoplasmopsis anatis]|uniref:ATP synthase F1 subunit delta n=1 Tax=Mycoplasmopsis anatis TaxID=171279 RepID=UPI001C4E1B76|nr:ATP synthase F1 subunit delta [Mycoplasmopsis anatis]MBW0603528.1 ATP synthase F1 subunit delta [Mycoplasmopsis anatis]